jgi:hypothetical protein
MVIDQRARMCFAVIAKLDKASSDASVIVSSNPNWLTHPNASSAFDAIFEGDGAVQTPNYSTRSVCMNRQVVQLPERCPGVLGTCVKELEWDRRMRARRVEDEWKMSGR